MKTYETLTIEQSGTTTIAYLNRPPLNTFNTMMMEELISFFHSLRNNADVRFIVISTKGKIFSAGADLNELNELVNNKERGAINARLHQLRGQEMLRSLEALEQITIGALPGAIIGGGAALASSCDFRILAEDSYFSVPEAVIGYPYTWGCTPRLVRIVGASRAMEIIMLCEPIPAQEAYRIGLANRVVPPNRLMEFTHDFIAKIAKSSPTSNRITKKIALGASMQGFGNMFSTEPEIVPGLIHTGEPAEGMQAFLEKRPPKY